MFFAVSAPDAYFRIDLRLWHAVIIKQFRCVCMNHAQVQVRRVYVAVGIGARLREFDHSTRNRRLSRAAFTAEDEQLLHGLPPQ
jgi:hypothetical protein